MSRQSENVARYADMLAALGTEPRLRIIRLLLSAHPDGMNAWEIQGDLGIPNSTLSHHLDKLKNEELVRVQRAGTFLRYMANTEALQEVLSFLYAECCTRNKAISRRTSYKSVDRSHEHEGFASCTARCAPGIHRSCARRRHSGGSHQASARRVRDE